jgi:hypothetical protein
MTIARIKSIVRSLLRRGFLRISVVLAFLVLPLQARAICQEGCDASNNTFLGDDTLLNNLGFDNTAIGFQALHNNECGGVNTATGAYALYSQTGCGGGGFNTATGAYALYSNQGALGDFGTENTATGAWALYSNTDGKRNTSNGFYSLYHNTAGNYNTADGLRALFRNTTANYNTALGSFALEVNTTGFQNTATGASALASNGTGNRNVAEGYAALSMNRTGNSNTAVGFTALIQNVGSNNVALGFGAGGNLTGGSGNVCIGYNVFGVAGESNTTRIKNVSASVASGRPVYVNSDNKIGTLVSSRRFKEEIKTMDKASEAILALKPVTFRYKKEIDPNSATMFGLVAEDVEKVDPDLVTRDDKGEPETVRYEAVNAMLLNEFLKEHRTVQELKSTVAKQEAAAAKQEATIARQQKQIEALTGGLQKVSDQLKLSRSAPRTVADNR